MVARTAICRGRREPGYHVTSVRVEITSIILTLMDKNEHTESPLDAVYQYTPNQLLLMPDINLLYVEQDPPSENPRPKRNKII